MNGRRPAAERVADRVIDPAIGWARARHFPPWAVLAASVPVIVVVIIVIVLPGEMLRPWDLRLRRNGMLIKIPWSQYRCWPPGIDAFDAEISKIRAGR